MKECFIEAKALPFFLETCGVWAADVTVILWRFCSKQNSVEEEFPKANYAAAGLIIAWFWVHGSAKLCQIL